MRPVLEGVRVIELAGIGPAPFCGMMLADHGAEVIRIDRPGGSDPLSQDQGRDVLLRSRRSITLDLKRPEAVEIVARLVETADGLIEGFRPGVAERLGIGPDVLMARNPALVYGRMTGWGQDGPLADKAGHDLNYISISGCLAALGAEDQPPIPPLNLIGDYGGGGMMLAFGFVSALLAARRSGAGRVIDCSMADGWTQPRPAPRFADTDIVAPKMWRRDSDRAAILAEIGAVDPDRVAAGQELWKNRTSAG